VMAFGLIVYFVYAYPLVTVSPAHFILSWRANGSLVERNGQVMGAEYMGHIFSSAKEADTRAKAARRIDTTGGRIKPGRATGDPRQRLHHVRAGDR
jgi:K+-transporting ATPase c subunit